MKYVRVGKPKEVIIWVTKHNMEGYWGGWHFYDEKKQRVTMFVPLKTLEFLGLEPDKPYRIIVQEIEHEYI